MLKRFFAIGAAFALAFSLSLSAFADSNTTLYLGFPLYGHTRVRQNNSQIYLSSEGLEPISSDSASGLNGSAGSIVFDFFPMSDPVTFIGHDQETISIPYYAFSFDSSDEVYLYFHNATDSGYSRVDNPIYGFDSEVIHDSQTIDHRQYTEVYCNEISSGQYVLEGTLIFDQNAVGSLDAWENMFSGLSCTVIDTNSNSYPIGMTAPVFRYYRRNNQDFVNFRLCLDVPFTGQYQRLFFSINSSSSSPIPVLKGFLVNTGSIRFEEANSTQSLSILLGTWFDKLIGTIKANSVSDDDKAAQAEESADREAVSEAQSQVSEIKSFESSLNSSITESVSNIDFTIPSSFGAALGAVGFVFGGLFSDLGGYQIVITIPLILGIMLILIGRGTLALGRIVSSNARAARRGEHKGGES